MKIIKYNLCSLANYGTEDEPQIVEVLSAVELGWSEANEEIAKREAYNGEYTIEDDGVPEPETEPTEEEKRIAELEATVNALLGVSE